MTAPPPPSGPAFAAFKRRGIMLILSSPSGAGKTTISRRLLERNPDIVMSVSATTRPPRPSEIDGKDYHFVDRETFEGMVDRGELLEHALVFDNFYGTPRVPVEVAIAAGQTVLFDIDWQGAQQLRQDSRPDVVSIFVLPPSLAELERRLQTRAQDSVDVVKSRMAKAGEEMSHWPEYDYVIINVDLNSSVQAIESIVAAERLRRRRQLGLAEFVTHLRGLG